MLSRITKIFLFLSAFLPLFFILAIQNYQQYGLRVLIPVVVIVLSTTAWLLLFLRWVHQTAPRSLEVNSVERKDAEVIAYLLTYIFPFLELKIADLSHLLSLGVFFLVLMILNVNANLIHINPVFNLLGYHIYEIKDGEKLTQTLISKSSRLRQGKQLRAVMIGDDLFMEAKHGDSNL